MLRTPLPKSENLPDRKCPKCDTDLSKFADMASIGYLCGKCNYKDEKKIIRRKPHNHILSSGSGLDIIDRMAIRQALTEKKKASEGVWYRPEATNLPSQK